MIKKIWNVGRIIVESAVVMGFVVHLVIGCASDTGSLAKYDGCVSQGEQTELRLAANKPKDTTG